MSNTLICILDQFWPAPLDRESIYDINEGYEDPLITRAVSEGIREHGDEELQELKDYMIWHGHHLFWRRICNKSVGSQ